ncbi:hypothetical protein J6TS2_32770 [Heyndrickxia sporothermodurans]|nr:hypothetical protein J6TS2_32770 [Heyndrickxia sporothermodurans]
MEVSVQNFILYYKSCLFDIMEEAQENNIADWVSIIVELLGAKQAVYYTTQNVKNNQLYIEYTYAPNQQAEFHNCITSDIVNTIFIEQKLANREKLTQFPMLAEFNCGFEFNYNELKKGYLFLVADLEKVEELIESNLEAFTYESEKFLHIINKHYKIMSEEKKYKELFRVTEKFHSSMDVDIVLREIIHTLKRVFPHFQTVLMLSNDTNHDKNLPIKELQFDQENSPVMECFVTGDIKIEEHVSNNQTLLNAPLCGKQGVYGVLQVETFSSFIFQNNEVEFIRLLANTGGSALENAKLYEQSQRLIEDLQLINETSHRLNSSSRLDETLHFLKTQISKSFHTEQAGFVLLKEDEPIILEGSSGLHNTPGGKKCIEYMTENISLKKESILISDARTLFEDEALPYASIMAVPMLESDTLKGYCLIAHEFPYFFTFEMFKLFQSLIHHSTLAVTNSMLREELERMVITDHLTQLFAKSFLNNEVIQSMKKDEEGTFILLDIDNFKEVNDTYGHQIGDEILIQVAKIIQKNIRASDIGARWGGEELAIYLPNLPLNKGVQVANRLVKTVYENTNPKITVSCGVSYWNKQRKDELESLFHRADLGLYDAKELGKNQVVIKEEHQYIS